MSVSFVKLSVGVPRNAVSSKSRVYLLKDGDPVGCSARRSVGLSKRTVHIGRTGFNTISSLPDPTQSLNSVSGTLECLKTLM